MPWLEAGIAVLEREGVLLDERTIVRKCKEYKLRPITGETPHGTLHATFLRYLEREKHPLIRRMSASCWIHVKPLAANAQAVRLHFEELNREGNSNDLRRCLVDLLNLGLRYQAIHTDDKHVKSFVDLMLHAVQVTVPGQNTQTLRRPDQVQSQQSSHVRSSAVIVGHTGIGKSFMINCMAYLQSPRVLDTDPSRGYAWNDAKCSDDERKRMLGLAREKVLAELYELGATVPEQLKLLDEACQGLAFDSPQRRLAVSPAVALEQNRRLDELFRARMDHAWSMDEADEIDAHPWLLPSSTNQSMSTTTFAHHICFGALPAAITVFKAPEALRADQELRQRYSDQSYPGAFERAIALCERQRFQLVIGQGADLRVDRVHVAESLMSQQRDLVYSLATERKLVFYPIAGLRQGASWIDSPGSLDTEPLCKANLEKELRGAHQIIGLLYKGLEHDDPMKRLLLSSGINERILTDPLNHGIQLIEIHEQKKQPRTLEELQRYNARNNNTETQRQAERYIAKCLDETAEDLRSRGLDIYEGYSHIHQQRLFPALFVAQCLRYRELEGRKAEQHSMLEAMRASGGLQFIGAMHKLFYGYEQRTVAFVLKQIDELRSQLPPGLKKQCAPQLAKLHTVHSALCQLTLEGRASEEIGRTLMQATQGAIFPVTLQPNDYDCTLECSLTRSYDPSGVPMIACDHCQHWYHAPCLGLSKRDWTAYADPVENRKFFCSKLECQELALVLKQNERAQLKRTQIDSRQSSKRRK